MKDENILKAPRDGPTDGGYKNKPAYGPGVVEPLGSVEVEEMRVDQSLEICQTRLTFLISLKIKKPKL